MNKDYKGVLVIDYADRRLQQKIESIADLVYNLLKLEGPWRNGYRASMASKRLGVRFPSGPL